MTIKAQVPARDPSWERRFARQAASGEGGDADVFVAHVLARLDEGQRKFGDRWQTLTLDEFLRELSEEAVDLAAWAALAEQAIAEPRAVTALDAEIVAGLMEVARYGARAHRVLQVLGRITERHAAPARPSPLHASPPRRRWWQHLLPGGQAP